MIGASALVVILVVVLANALLYYRLRDGHITSLREMQTLRLTRFPTKPVHRLVLSGTVWANVIPSDSDYILVPKDEMGMRVTDIGVFGKTDIAALGRKPLFRVEGDTLYVNGSSEVPIHRPYAEWFYRQSIGQIYIYASSLDHIRVTNGQMVLKGADRLDSRRQMSLDAVGSTVWLAEMDARPEGKSMLMPLPSEFFDSVSLHLVNSVLLLNKPATVSVLYARLDSASELNDRGAVLTRPEINSSIDSRVSFTGENLKNMNVVIH